MKKLAAAVQKARECQHEDAQWLASLFPEGTAVTLGSSVSESEVSQQVD